MDQQPFTAAWLVMLLIGGGAAVIAFLSKRMLDDQRERLEEHDRDITDLKVGVATALAGNTALAEGVRVLRHDLKDVKHGVDGIMRILVEKK